MTLSGLLTAPWMPISGATSVTGLSEPPDTTMPRLQSSAKGSLIADRSGPQKRS